MVGLYPSIPHKEGILALKRKLEEQTSSKISSNYLVKLVEFVVILQFNNEIKKQISGTTIGSKFAPLYACIYMVETGTDFLKTQELQPFAWLRYIDNTFFIWAHREAEL